MSVCRFLLAPLLYQSSSISFVFEDHCLFQFLLRIIVFCQQWRYFTSVPNITYVNVRYLPVPLRIIRPLCPSRLKDPEHPSASGPPENRRRKEHRELSRTKWALAFDCLYYVQFDQPDVGQRKKIMNDVSSFGRVCCKTNNTCIMMNKRLQFVQNGEEEKRK